MIIKLNNKNEGYYGGRKWKPSKTAAREYYNKMSEIEEFIKDNGIVQSYSGDSYYFEIDNQKYRVSNHSVEASDAGAYKIDITTGDKVQVRDKYHNGRDDDVIYIHAGKTRIIDIYNDLKSGKKLDGRGNVIVERLIQSPSQKAFEKNISTEVRSGKPVKQAVAIAYSVQNKNKKKAVKEDIQEEPKLVGAILEFKEGERPLSITVGKLYSVERINKYLESEDRAVNFKNEQDGIGGYDKAYVDLVFEYKGVHYRAHLLRYDLGDLYKEYVNNAAIDYAKNKVKSYAEGEKSYNIYEVDPINYKRVENIVRESVEDIKNVSETSGLAAIIIDAIKSEFEAIKEYNDLIVMAEMENYPEIAKIALSIANEEKAHVGELQKALAMIDPTFEVNLESGEQEILDIVKESYTENSVFNQLRKQGKTLGDMREYQYQRNIAKQLGVDINKVDKMILNGKGYDEVSKFIYDNADKKNYEKVYNKDTALRESHRLDYSDARELINKFYKDASIELLKEVIEEYDGSEDENYLEHVKKELKDFGKTYDSATREELIKIIRYDVDNFILDNYVSKEDIQEYLDEYERLEKEERDHLKDLEHDWRGTRI